MAADLNIDGHDISLLGDWTEKPESPKPKSQQIFEAFMQGQDGERLANDFGVSVKEILDIVRIQCQASNAALTAMVGGIIRLRDTLHEQAERERTSIPLIINRASSLEVNAREAAYVTKMETAQAVVDLLNAMAIRRARAAK